MTDWQNRGGTVSAGVQLPPMDLNKEHVFELMSVDTQEGVQTKFGLKNKIKLVWKEADKEEGFHKVWLNFNESYFEKSNLVKFLISASGRPLLPGIPVKLGDFLSIGMRIRAMVQARIDSKTGAPSGYYDFITASVKPANAPVQPLGLTHGAQLQNALLICKGCSNAGDAAFRLAEARASADVVEVFKDANAKGLVKYPIV